MTRSLPDLRHHLEEDLVALQRLQRSGAGFRAGERLSETLQEAFCLPSAPSASTEFLLLGFCFGLLTSSLYSVSGFF